MELYGANDRRGARSRAGRLFFDEFRTRFWEEPSKHRNSLLYNQKKLYFNNIITFR